MPTYTVVVDREDGYWSAVVNDLPGGAFAGLEFEALRDMPVGVRDALVDFFGNEDFTLEWIFAMPEDPGTRGSR
ncbi:MAG: hypothetical protein L0I76_06325 [Pseudonocardia sp.]|nr:hypothetical protein [Pseudonocardia sp.]